MLNVILNDKSKSRIKILKSNLKRLRLSAEVLNEDFTKFNYKTKYDIIILDAPCSAIGTVRRTPEILFKNKGPNFDELIYLQEKIFTGISSR